jgi:hypothetical protein
MWSAKEEEEEGEDEVEEEDEQEECTIASSVETHEEDVDVEEEKEVEEGEVQIVAVHRRVALVDRSARNSGSALSGFSAGTAGPIRQVAQEQAAAVAPVAKRRLPLQAVANQVQKQARLQQESHASALSNSASASTSASAFASVSTSVAIPKSQHPVFSGSHLSEVDLTDEW